MSVLTPTYEAGETLGRALASLTTQSYSNWECVVVDDGSSDRTQDVLAEVKDLRVRCFRLDRNRGRGHARSVALEEARGELVCSLDADDWLYPDKLEAQVQAFQDHPDVAVVTVGMAVTDDKGDLVGVQGRVSQRRIQTIASPRALKFPFGPSMLAAELARRVGYNTSYPRGYDLDFYLRLLCGHDRRLCQLDRIGYVYQGHTKRTVGELLFGHECSRRVYREHFFRFPVDCGYLMLSSYAKSAVYRAALSLGLSDRVSLMRFTAPTMAEAREFALFRDALQEPL